MSSNDQFEFIQSNRNWIHQLIHFMRLGFVICKDKNLSPFNTMRLILELISFVFFVREKNCFCVQWQINQYAKRRNDWHDGWAQYILECAILGSRTVSHVCVNVYVFASLIRHNNMRDTTINYTIYFYFSVVLFHFSRYISIRTQLYIPFRCYHN